MSMQYKSVNYGFSKPFHKPRSLGIPEHAKLTGYEIYAVKADGSDHVLIAQTTKLSLVSEMLADLYRADMTAYAFAIYDNYTQIQIQMALVMAVY